MRNLIYTLAAIFCLAASSQATVITVNNLGGGDYSNLVDAYNAASNGDTIYIEPTELSYGDLLNINKSLTWVGIGGIPATDDVHRSIVRRMTLDTGASDSRFYGVYFLDYLAGATPDLLENLLVENCLFGDYISINDGPIINMIVRNCIFLNPSQFNMYFYDADSLADRSSVIVTNCFISQRFEGYSNSFNLITVDHCLISSVFTSFSNSLNGAVIRNNYFTSDFNNSSPGGVNNVFLNNFIRGGAGSSIGVTNSGSNNQFNTTMSFVNYNGFSSWLSSHDYNLLPGSNGIGAATDSTDIGIHGGNSHFSNSTETLWIPIVRSMSFTGDPIPFVQPGDTLNINIEASRPQVD